MADTLNNVILPRSTWVDLYAATGIVVGTSISVENNSEYDVRLTEKATQPLASDGYVHLSPNTNISKTFEDTPSGAWAYCQMGGILNVQALA